MAARIRIVANVEWLREPLARFIALSIGVHAALVVAVILGALGLAKYMIVDRHHGVGGKHEIRRSKLRDCHRLGSRQPYRHRLRHQHPVHHRHLC